MFIKNIMIKGISLICEFLLSELVSEQVLKKYLTFWQICGEFVQSYLNVFFFGSLRVIFSGGPSWFLKTMFSYKSYHEIGMEVQFKYINCKLVVVEKRPPHDCKALWVYGNTQ